MKTILPLVALLGIFSSLSLSAREPAADSAWQPLFDGKTLEGWKANERPGSFTVSDGVLVVRGPRSHLFYVGSVGEHDFKNFELTLDVLTKPKANSGIFFHTGWQEDGWPARGYEVQINNSHKDPKRTAGLYAVKDNYDVVAKDDQWFNVVVRVEGKRVVTTVDGKTVCDYTEPNDLDPGDQPLRRLGHGTICIQAHDPESEAHYKNIRIRLLP
jgi:hypothetical protein